MIQVNQNPLPWEPDLYLDQLLKQCRYSFPLLIIRINDKLIPREAYPQTLIQDGDEITVIHLMSGG